MPGAVVKTNLMLNAAVEQTSSALKVESLNAAELLFAPRKKNMWSSLQIIGIGKQEILRV